LELREQRAAWEARPLLRKLYNGWYDQLAAQLAQVDGVSLELGCGIGTLKERYPGVVPTDVVPTPWAERVVNAEKLPYEDGALANVVMVDVLHHIPRPDAFFSELERTLRPGGRSVCLEPYCSPISTVVFKLCHHERTKLRVDPFANECLSTEDPFDSNQALPTLLFWRESDRFKARHPTLRIVYRQRLATLVYPLSGGFTKRPLLSLRSGSALLALEERASFITRAAAFRCLVTLEKEAA
jgi:SAM-dependent methyltransferase